MSQNIKVGIQIVHQDWNWKEAENDDWSGDVEDQGDQTIVWTDLVLGHTTRQTPQCESNNKKSKDKRKGQSNRELQCFDILWYLGYFLPSYSCYFHITFSSIRIAVGRYSPNVDSAFIQVRWQKGAGTQERARTEDRPITIYWPVTEDSAFERPVHHPNLSDKKRGVSSMWILRCSIKYPCRCLSWQVFPLWRYQ